MRILISGGGGFLGSHLTDLLLEQGHEVVGVDNFLTGQRENIAHLNGKPGYTFIEADVIEPVKLSGSFDRIFHMASPASPIAQAMQRPPIVRRGTPVSASTRTIAAGKRCASSGGIRPIAPGLPSTL